MTTRAYVGLGEGIGNVVMGLPLVDACRSLGWHTTIGLAMTPEGIAADMTALLVEAGYSVELWGDSPYDVACLTHWYLTAGGYVPEAGIVRMGAVPSDGTPEIASNLEALDEYAVHARQGPRLTLEAEGHTVWARPLVALHAGCKPAWRGRKLYPRWHEVVHRVQDEGGCVVAVGGAEDRDIYLGRPDEDLRGECSLLETARLLQEADVVLSGDSGLHHLAVALGRPTVALFFDTSPEKARHPEPAGDAPVVLGPFPDLDHFRNVSPYCIARATIRAAGARVENVA